MIQSTYAEYVVVLYLDAQDILYNTGYSALSWYKVLMQDIGGSTLYLDAKNIMYNTGGSTLSWYKVLMQNIGSSTLSWCKEDNVSYRW